MKTKRALARVWHELVSLSLECVFAVVVLALVAAIVPTILILAAQFYRLATTGDWRGFAFSELVDVLGINPSALADESQPIAQTILALPATLVLSLASIALCLTAYVLHRLLKRERVRFSGKQQNALIEDIERQLGKQ